MNVRSGKLLALATVVALVLFRSALFVLRPYLSFDSDQAVFGLMAKHIVEGRAFPLFMYGQSYLLAVEAWLAAFSFMIAGVSAAVLKLTLLFLNAAVALLLVILVRREVRVGWGTAVLASVFFVLAPPGTAGELMTANGCNVEPFLYVLLLWTLRRRPVWFGLILAIGFLQREFTIYGFVAIVVLGMAEAIWRRKIEWQPALRAVRSAAEVWLIVQFLRRFAPAAGPGTSAAALDPRVQQWFEPLGRLCYEPAAALKGLGQLITFHWPRLFGTERLPVGTFALESHVSQGLAWTGPLLGGLMLLFVGRIIVHARAERKWWRSYQFCAYLVIVGCLSAVVLATGRCGQLDVMRYDLLSILGAVGLTAWALAVESRTWIRRTATVLLVFWALVSTVGHAQLWTEYLRQRQVPDKILIIRNLEARGIQYATADYWIAYYVTFLTNERIIVAANDYSRIASYDSLVNAHRAEAVEISRRPCEDGIRVFEGVYFCKRP